MKRDPTGMYDKRITLLFPTGNVSVVDGVEVPNYGTGATIWAAFDVKPPRGKEIQVGQADHAISTIWIKIRYLSELNATWRIKYGTTIYEIISPPIDDGMKHWELYLELKVVE